MLTGTNLLAKKNSSFKEVKLKSSKPKTLEQFLDTRDQYSVYLNNLILITMNCHSRLVAFLEHPSHQMVLLLSRHFSPIVISTLWKFYGTTNSIEEAKCCDSDQVLVGEHIDSSGEEALKAVIEKKVAANIQTALQPQKKKTWRCKTSEAVLKGRYLNESYVATLLLCTRHDAYDTGKKPICLKKCSHNCQKQFTFDKLKQELRELRRILLQEDLRRGFVSRKVNVPKTTSLTKNMCAGIFIFELVEYTIRLLSTSNKI